MMAADRRSDGRRLILVPGLGLEASAWEPTVRGLAEARPGAFEAETALLPGFGRRAPRHQQLDPWTLARWLVERAGPFDANTVLAGHSASCQVVAAAAALAPETIGGLILVGPTPDPRPANWPRILASWGATALHEPPWQVPTLLRQYSKTGLATMARTMDQARRQSIAAVLAAARCPTLVMRGRSDRIAPADWCAALVDAADSSSKTEGADASRRSRAMSLPSGAHMVPLTDGPVSADALAQFFA